jgi:hypothetical protein
METNNNENNGHDNDGAHPRGRRRAREREREREGARARRTLSWSLANVRRRARRDGPHKIRSCLVGDRRLPASRSSASAGVFVCVFCAPRTKPARGRRLRAAAATSSGDTIGWKTATTTTARPARPHSKHAAPLRLMRGPSRRLMPDGRRLHAVAARSRLKIIYISHCHRPLRACGARPTRRSNCAPAPTANWRALWPPARASETAGRPARPSERTPAKPSEARPRLHGRQ